MTYEQARLNYLAKKFGITSLELETTTRDTRTEERQRYLDDEQKRKDRNRRKMGEDIYKGMNRYRIFAFWGEASYKDESKPDKTIGLQVTLKNRF
jgi:hypothetical protein